MKSGHKVLVRSATVEPNMAVQSLRVSSLKLGKNLAEAFGTPNAFLGKMQAGQE